MGKSLSGGKGGGGKSAAAAPTTIVNTPDTRSNDEYLAILKMMQDEAEAAQAANMKAMNPEQTQLAFQQGSIIDALRST